MPDLLTIVINSMLLASWLILPGYLVQMITFRKAITRRTISEVFFLALLTGVATTSALGLILTQLGIFSVFRLSMLLGFLSITLLFLTNVKGIAIIPKGLKSATRRDVLAATVFAFAFFVFVAHSYETLHGGWDPGIYVTTGVNIAKSGSWIIESSVISHLDPATRGFLYGSVPASLGTIYQAHQFPAFFITDASTGQVIPQFLPGYPVWIAIFYSLFDIRSVFYVNVLFALVSLSSIFLLARRIFNAKVAYLSVALLTVNFAEIWYSNFSTAEITVQMLLFGGLYVLSVYLEKNDAILAIVSSSLLGLTFQTRIDAFYILPAVGALFVYHVASGRARSYLLFYVTFFLWTVYGVLADLIFSRPYVLTLSSESNQIFATGPIPPSNLLQMLSLSTPIQITALALIGITWAAWRERRQVTIVLAIIFATVSTVIYINPVTDLGGGQIWVARRFVEILIPSIVLFGSYGIVRLGSSQRLEKPAAARYLVRFVVALLIVSIFFQSILASAPLINYSEFQGIIGGYDNLASKLPYGALILTDDFFTASPLAYVYGKDVVYTFPFDGPNSTANIDVAAYVSIQAGLNRYNALWSRLPAMVAELDVSGVYFIHRVNIPLAWGAIDLVGFGRAVLVARVDLTYSQIRNYRLSLPDFNVDQVVKSYEIYRILVSNMTS